MLLYLSPANYKFHLQNWNFGQIHVWLTNSFAEAIHSRQLWCAEDILLTNQLYQEVLHQ